MDFNLNVDLVRSQKLILTPQLKQAIEILSMNSQELFEYVEEQLEKNPVLETYGWDERWNDGSMVNAGFFEWDDASNIQDYDYTSDETDETIMGLSERRVYKLSLKEHLYFQLCNSNLPQKMYPLAEYMINSVNENGFIDLDLKQTARKFNVSRKSAENVLKLLQSFDPPGICARNLKECFLIQIQAQGKDKDYVKAIIENHLDKIAEGDFAYISEELGININKVVEAFNLLKSLEPKPGRAFYKNDGVKFIIPDIIIKRDRNNFEVYFNEDAIPMIGINRYYRNMLNGDVCAETKKFIQNYLDSAIRLIDCIEKRKDILIKLVESLINRQKEFFEKGRKYLKPLHIKFIAEDIGVHESIIHRSIKGKYIQCSWGIFEVRYFFR